MVDLGQIDPLLPSVRERIQSAHDVIAVDAQVEREMIPGPRRDTRVRQVELGGDLGHDRLRPVPSGHGHGVGSASHRRAHQLLEIVPPPELDRLDAPPPRFLGQVEPSRLPAA